MKTFTFSQAVTGFELSCRARHLSPNTIDDYSRTMRKFSTFIGEDVPINQITAGQVEAFLATQNVSKKSLLNYFIGLSALWTWCLREKLVAENIIHVLNRPKPEKRKIDPFTQDQIRTILGALKHSKPYQRPNGKNVAHELGNEERNRAIILVLLDTGIRATELCDLEIADLDIAGNRLRIRQGKGDKERFVPFSSRTGQALWKYLGARKNSRYNEPIFLTKNERPMTRNELAHGLQIIGNRARVSGVHPHRFRHTFAINYLRNGGDAYTLQEILGHSTMEMVKVYLKLADTDLAASHRRASPVDHWML